MNIENFIQDWVEATNTFNIKNYLDFYASDAILDDPSVGKKFVGHEGIESYYTSYFIGYKTQTKLIKLIINNDTAYMEVEFTGEFPGGKIGGMFDIIFKEGKIHRVKADLL